MLIPAGSQDQQSPASNSQSFWPGLETANFDFVLQNVFANWNQEFATGRWSLFPTWCCRYVLSPFPLLPVDLLIPTIQFSRTKLIHIDRPFGNSQPVHRDKSRDLHRKSVAILKLCVNMEGSLSRRYGYEHLHPRWLDWNLE